MEFLEVFQYEFMWRALLASSMVGIMCGVLGSYIILRNMALVGDALSHAILPGVVVAFIFFGYHTFGFFIGSVLAGLAAAVAITWVQQTFNTRNDAAIGIVFTAMFSLGVIGISHLSQQEGVHLDLKDFLFGNVLGVSDQDLWMTAFVLIFVLVSVVILYRHFFISTFQPVIAETMGYSVKSLHYFLMLMLSFAIVASLQTVGVILVVAMLITPASAALLWTNSLHKVLFISAFIGLLSAVTGLVISVLLETTPGPAMAVVATIFYLISAVIAPTHGLIFKWKQKRLRKLKILQEDILKLIYRHGEDFQLSFQQIKNKIEENNPQLRSAISRLKNNSLLNKHDDQYILTGQGKRRAQDLVRAHRLWETYLVNELGLEETQIHNEAERYEHLLTEELIDEVDHSLGYPNRDPHGSPIPMKHGQYGIPLVHIETGEKVLILPEQLNDHSVSTLWTHRIQADDIITIVKKGGETILIKKEGNEEVISIPRADANNIAVKKI